MSVVGVTRVSPSEATHAPSGSVRGVEFEAALGGGSRDGP